MVVVAVRSAVLCLIIPVRVISPRPTRLAVHAMLRATLVPWLLGLFAICLLPTPCCCHASTAISHNEAPEAAPWSGPGRKLRQRRGKGRKKQDEEDGDKEEGAVDDKPVSEDTSKDTEVKAAQDKEDKDEDDEDDEDEAPRRKKGKGKGKGKGRRKRNAKPPSEDVEKEEVSKQPKEEAKAPEEHKGRKQSAKPLLNRAAPQCPRVALRPPRARRSPPDALVARRR